jgi:hypothetical protein
MYLFSQLFKTVVSLQASFLRVKQSPENMFFSIQQEIASGKERPRNDS